ATSAPALLWAYYFSSSMDIALPRARKQRRKPSSSLLQAQSMRNDFANSCVPTRSERRNIVNAIGLRPSQVLSNPDSSCHPAHAISRSAVATPSWHPNALRVCPSAASRRWPTAWFAVFGRAPVGRAARCALFPASAAQSRLDAVPPARGALPPPDVRSRVPP